MPTIGQFLAGLKAALQPLHLYEAVMAVFIKAKAVAEDGEEILIVKKCIQPLRPGMPLSFTREYRAEGFPLSPRGPHTFSFQYGPRCGKMYSVDPVAFPDF